MRKATYAALIAPALLALAPLAPEKVSFAPKAGATVTKTFSNSTTMELEDMEVLMGGQPAPMPGDPEMKMESTQTVTVTDTYGKLEGGRLDRLERTYDSIGMEMEMAVEMGMTQEMSGDGSSRLEGRTVVFAWDEKEGDFVARYAEDEEGDPALLEGLEINMDLRGLLPSGDLAVGDSYDIDPMGLADLLVPGGNLSLEMEMDGAASAGVPGADPGQMGDFSAFFDDVIEGDATGKLKEIREVDGKRLAVIELEFDVSGSADLTELVADAMANSDELPPGMSMDVERMEMAMTYEGKGELLWDLGAGLVHSCTLTAEVSTQMDMAMSIGDMEITMDMAMSGEMKSSVAVE